MNYEEYAQTIKALSDPNRVKILDILSCDTECACNLLDHFNFTQPTLSHHIKVLRDANIVRTEKKGNWHHYSINQETVDDLMNYTQNIFSSNK